MALEHEQLTGSVIGAAIEVHRALGPGFLEAVYENALAIELRARGIGFDRQLAVPILYRGTEVGLHRLDLLVARLPSQRSKSSVSLPPNHHTRNSWLPDFLSGPIALRAAVRLSPRTAR
jgi:GxxExxY protein